MSSEQHPMPASPLPWTWEDFRQDAPDDAFPEGWMWAPQGSFLLPSGMITLADTYEGSGEDIRYLLWAANTAPALAAEVERLRAALEEISKGEGAFSTDQLTHANNTIENMLGIAKAALEAK